MNNKHMLNIKKCDIKYEEKSMISVDDLNQKYPSYNSIISNDGEVVENKFFSGQNKHSEIKRIVFNFRNHKSPVSRSKANCNKLELNNDIRLISTSIFPLSNRNKRKCRNRLGIGAESRSKQTNLSKESVDSEPKKEMPKITAFMKYLQSLHAQGNSENKENDILSIKDCSSEYQNRVSKSNNLFTNLNFDNNTMLHNKSRFNSPNK